MRIPEVKFYNTLGRAKEAFVPIREGEAGIYVCGVTVYDLCHLGHIRAAVNFDVLRSFLVMAGYKVRMVKNYTDIDDKMIARANERGISCEALAGEMIRRHDEDMALFYVRPPDEAPKATEHIPEMIDMISRLIGKGLAYESGGDVYFRAARFDGYGQLSGKKLEGMESGIRVKVSEQKQDEFDFVLWKASKPGEPSWNSPWGPGRPGWHIECSAMSAKFLGEQFDIHGGGLDLIFPHHENEIAQSCGCFGKAPAKIWLHNGMVEVEGGKMSKSVGNVLSASDLTAEFHPEVVRFYILKTHYRQRMNFDREHAAVAAENLDRLYGVMQRFGWQGRSPGQTADAQTIEDLWKSPFFSSMADDLNTPEAMAWLFAEAKALNGLELESKAARQRMNVFAEACYALGVLNEHPEQWFAAPRVRKARPAADEKAVKALLQERSTARAAKNWKRSDELRDQLIEMGVGIKDKGEETTWYYL